MKCDQCEMVSVNGIACHEHGCPNRDLTWNEDYGRFIKTRECSICGYTVELGEVCCNDHEEYYADADDYEEVQS